MRKVQGFSAPRRNGRGEATALAAPAERERDAADQAAGHSRASPGRPTAAGAGASAARSTRGAPSAERRREGDGGRVVRALPGGHFPLRTAARAGGRGGERYYRRSVRG